MQVSMLNVYKSPSFDLHSGALGAQHRSPVFPKRRTLECRQVRPSQAPGPRAACMFVQVHPEEPLQRGWSIQVTQ